MTIDTNGKIQMIEAEPQYNMIQLHYCAVPDAIVEKHLAEKPWINDAWVCKCVSV